MGDMLSGYRVFSRRFVKSFPAVSREFEIETELTVHSLALRIPSTSVPVDFRDRAEGSESKLRTYRDGWRILNMILSLTRHERPMFFFGLLAALFGLDRRGARHAGASSTYLQTGMVPRTADAVRRVVPAGDQLPGPDGRAWCSTGSASRGTSVSRLSYMRYPAVRDAYVLDPTHGRSARMQSMRPTVAARPAAEAS